MKAHCSDGTCHKHIGHLALVRERGEGEGFFSGTGFKIFGGCPMQTVNPSPQSSPLREGERR